MRTKLGKLDAWAGPARPMRFAFPPFQHLRKSRLAMIIFEGQVSTRRAVFAGPDLADPAKLRAAVLSAAPQSCGLFSFLSGHR